MVHTVDSEAHVSGEQEGSPPQPMTARAWARWADRFAAALMVEPIEGSVLSFRDHKKGAAEFRRLADFLHSVADGAKRQDEAPEAGNGVNQ